MKKNRKRKSHVTKSPENYFKKYTLTILSKRGGFVPLLSVSILHSTEKLALITSFSYSNPHLLSPEGDVDSTLGGISACLCITTPMYAWKTTALYDDACTIQCIRIEHQNYFGPNIGSGLYMFMSILWAAVLLPHFCIFTLDKRHQYPQALSSEI